MNNLLTISVVAAKVLVPFDNNRIVLLCPALIKQDDFILNFIPASKKMILLGLINLMMSPYGQKMSLFDFSLALQMTSWYG